MRVLLINNAFVNWRLSLHKPSPNVQFYKDTSSRWRSNCAEVNCLLACLFSPMLESFLLCRFEVSQCLYIHWGVSVTGSFMQIHCKWRFWFGSFAFKYEWFTKLEQVIAMMTAVFMRMQVATPFHMTPNGILFVSHISCAFLSALHKNSCGIFSESIIHPSGVSDNGFFNSKCIRHGCACMCTCLEIWMYRFCLNTFNVISELFIGFFLSIYSIPAKNSCEFLSSTLIECHHCRINVSLGFLKHASKVVLVTQHIVPLLYWINSPPAEMFVAMQ